MKIKHTTWILWVAPLGIALWSTLAFATPSTTPLTLVEAEQLALALDPEVQRLRVSAQSLDEQAIADGQLPDPKLIVGAVNVPTNTLSFTQDDMTMVAAGIQQSFPPGRSLHFKSEQTKALAEAGRQQTATQTLLLVQNIRNTWLDLYYWLHAQQVLHANRALSTYLTKATESQYSVGKSSQSDVLQTQVELARLDDQRIQITQQIALLRAQLSRWIGQAQANRPLSSQLPHWVVASPLASLQPTLQQHPLLKADAANIQASRDEVAYAKEQYKPGIMLDVGYGVRQGQMTDGVRRSDMATAQITLDLPIFTHQRQDRGLKAKTYQLEAAQLEQQAHYRELSSTLAGQYAAWQLLKQRERLFTQHLIPEAAQNAKAALHAYQSTTTDILPVLRAYAAKLDVELAALQVHVAAAKARVALLYLEGGRKT